jgi:hypothetical protein
MGARVRSLFGFSIASLLVLGGVLAGVLGGAASRANAQSPQSVFTTQTPALTNLSDGAGVNYELGMRFYAVSAGEVTALRFWKDTLDPGTHVGKLWSATGQLLATATFSNETAGGWQEAALPSPVAIQANVEYTVSVNTASSFYRRGPRGPDLERRPP